MQQTVKYLENQYIDEYLVLVKLCSYELKIDSLNNRYFIVNQNNELIYLDQIDATATVQNSLNKIVYTSFFGCLSNTVDE